MANTIVAGYAAPVGDKYIVRFDHFGPTSYTQANNSGVVTTGGDVVNASDIGMGGFEVFDVPMIDPTGQFYALAVLTNGGVGNAVPSVVIIWYSRVTATVGGQAQVAGTQVLAATNLSTFSLRCDVWCV